MQRTSNNSRAETGYIFGIVRVIQYLSYLSGRKCEHETLKYCKVKLQRQTACHDSNCKHGCHILRASDTQGAFCPCGAGNQSRTFLCNTKSTISTCYDGETGGQHGSDVKHRKTNTKHGSPHALLNWRTGWKDAQTSAGAHCAETISCTRK